VNTLAIKLPDVGEGITQAELVEWNVKVGDFVREDDIIAAVMTDKATVEIPCLYDGTIVQTNGEIGDSLAIGSDLVLIETEADGVSVEPDEVEQFAPEPAVVEEIKKPVPAAEKVVPVVEKQAFTPSTPTLAIPRAEGAPVLASPAVRARARNSGIDLRLVHGSGPAGRITDADLDQYSQSASQLNGNANGSSKAKREGTEEIKVIGMRRKIAERMSKANANVPHITVVEEVDVTALEDLRAKLNSERGDKQKLTILPILSAALSRAVYDHPEMNAHYDDEKGVVIRHAPVHIGIATMTDAGLMVPVLRHAEAKGLFEAAQDIQDIADAARTGSANREQLSGSTITISSLGPLGAIVTTPIINLPEVAIVGVNKIAIRPVWEGDQFVPRKMMNISASFDHRIIDGWDAAVFVQKIKSLLETPALIFVEA
jgi:2-oxoisovalerate dehydrogenase E2 component (dihydrolipoyl transacylase)